MNKPIDYRPSICISIIADDESASFSNIEPIIKKICEAYRDCDYKLRIEVENIKRL